MKHSRSLLALALATAVLVPALPAFAQANKPVVNLYSARHYPSDQAIYKGFQQKTGIEVRLIEGNDAAMIERIRNEGANSPADVLLLVDAARLWKAEQEGMFAPVDSALLRERIPASLQGADTGKGPAWWGFSTRARAIAYDKSRVKPEQVDTYAKLASPELKGMVCTRSGSHPYMLSLIGALSVHMGEAKTEEWARGVVANFAREPRGGDTDQIRGVASGECAVAVSNSYYLARLMRSDKAEDRAVAEKVGWVWPDQQGMGTHMNVSGAGMVKSAPNPEAAKKFLEYLASDEAQRIFAESNNEWPAVASVKVDNPALNNLGEFKVDPLKVSEFGAAQGTAARILDRVGWR